MLGDRCGLKLAVGAGAVAEDQADGLALGGLGRVPSHLEGLALGDGIVEVWEEEGAEGLILEVGRGECRGESHQAR